MPPFPDTASQRSILEDVSVLIDEAAFAPERWTAVLAELARRVPGTKVALQVVDAHAERGLPMLTVGFDQHVVDAYAQHYGTINPWVPLMVAAPSGKVLYSEELRPAASFRRTAFYSDWLARGGGIDASSGVKLVDSAGRLGVLVAHYEARRATRTNDVLAPLLARLAPRLRRSLEATRTASLSRPIMSERSLLSAIVEPAFVVAGDLRLQDANAAAQELLARGDLLRLGGGERLRFIHAAFGAAFAREVAQATLAAAVRPHAFGASPMVATSDGHVSLSAITLRPDLLQVTGLTRLWTPRTLALVIVRPYAPARGDLAQHLARAHGLTDGETRLALALADGASLRRAAEALGLNYETARSRLKRVFAKLDVRRQSELAAYLTRLR